MEAKEGTGGGVLSVCGLQAGDRWHFHLCSNAHFDFAAPGEPQKCCSPPVTIGIYARSVKQVNDNLVFYLSYRAACTQWPVIFNLLSRKEWS
jgi:hypothetical protein